MKKFPLIVFVVISCVPLFAAEWMTLQSPAVAYDGPSDKSRAIYVILQGTPVEALVLLSQWAKIRDIKGDVMWIERRKLGFLSTVLVIDRVAKIRSEPSGTASVVLEVGKDVVLELTAPPERGWVLVRHANKDVKGYLPLESLWPSSALTETMNLPISLSTGSAANLGVR